MKGTAVIKNLNSYLFNYGVIALGYCVYGFYLGIGESSRIYADFYLTRNKSTDCWQCISNNNQKSSLLY